MIRSKEKKHGGTVPDSAGDARDKIEKVPFSRKLGWLNRLLWGGSALLAFEHVWHGETVPWFPFLTATSTSASASLILGEMLTVGVSMAAFVTGVWAVMLAVSTVIEKKSRKALSAES